MRRMAAHGHTAKRPEKLAEADWVFLESAEEIARKEEMDSRVHEKVHGETVDGWVVVSEDEGASEDEQVQKKGRAKW